jgi:DNA-directed RNA polymerase specialized sigma subunit
VKDYLNSKFAYLVDERIHNKRDREIMKLHYIDGVSAEEISKMKGVDLTPRRVSQILSDRLLEIAPFL